MGNYYQGWTLSADGRYFSFSNGSEEIPVWDARGGEVDDHRPERSVRVPGVNRQSLAISPSGQTMAVADSGTVYLAPISASPGPSSAAVRLDGNSYLTNLRFIDEQHLVAAADDMIVMWDLTRQSRLGQALSGDQFEVPWPCRACRGVALSTRPDGGAAAVVGGWSEVLVLALDDAWPAARPLNLAQPLAAYTDAVWTSDGSYLVLSVQSIIGALGVPSAEVRSADGSTVLGTWPSSSTARLGLAQAPNGVIYDVDVYGNVTVREPLTGAVLTTVPGPDDLEPDLRVAGGSALNAEAAVAAFVQRGDLRVEDLTTGRTETIASKVAAVAFAGDTMIVRRADGTNEIRSADGTQVLAAHGENQGFDPSRQSAGNDTLRAHVMDNSRVSLLDTRANVEIGSFPMSRAADADKAGATFTPDGTTLVLAAPGGPASEVQRWSVSPADWMRIACNTAGRDLLAAEWEAATETTGAPADLRCSR